MQKSLIFDKYVIVDILSTNVNLTIYRCLESQLNLETYFRIHQIKDRKLIKYYLKHIETFKSTLPFIDSFIASGDLFLVFKDYSNEPAIDKKQFNDSDRKDFILKILAKLSLDSSLPNFIKYTLLKSDNLRVDSNGNIHFNVTLDLLNPESFEDFKSVQKKIATLIESLTEEHDELNTFIMNCEVGLYSDYINILADYKRYLGTINAHEEPWIYEKLLWLVLWIKKHFRFLVYLVLLFIIVIFGVTTFTSSTAESNKPYVKDRIGAVTYKDPYNEIPQETETISVYVPIMNTPPTSVEPQEKLLNEYEIYIVPAGDYLYKIALDTYGDEKYANTLAIFNGLEDPNFLPVNYPLKLPTSDRIEALYELIGR